MWVDIFKKTLLSGLVLLLAIGGFSFYESNISALVPQPWRERILNVFFALFLIIIGALLQKAAMAALNFYKNEIAVKTETEIDDKFIPLFGRLIGLLIWVSALIVLLSRLGMNISALVAALGVSSLAIALAAQDTIANIISGFLIMIDRPFAVGDHINLPSGEKVEVLEVGIRRSKFRLLESKAVAIVPNLDLSKSKIVNYTYGNGKEKK